MEQTPVSLLLRLRDPNDRTAWDELVALVSPFLHSIARRQGLNDEQAADLVQDVWVVLVRTLPAFRYDPARSFRAWLARIVRRKLIDRWRQPGLPVVDTAEWPETLAPDEAFGEDEYRRWLVARALELLQQQGAPRQLHILHEYILKGRPGPEVAAELGMTPNALYLAERRLLAQLRTYLEGLL